MVIFNECRIVKGGRDLIIDIEIDSLTYYKDVYLKAIYIDKSSNFKNSTNPSDKAYKMNLADIAEIDGNPTTNIKSYRLKINSATLGLESFSNDIFFIYVEVEGLPTEDTPCCKYNKYTMAVAIDLNPVYNIAMNHIKALSDDCKINTDFINSILRYKALDLAVKTGNYTSAIHWWNKFKGTTITSSSTSNNCGCNGTY